MTFIPNQFSKRKQVNITICGLDNVGKTSVINYIVYGERRNVAPTITVNMHTLNLKKLKINIFDLGGQEHLRPSWTSFIKQSQAMIYLVDCTDMERLDLTKSIFSDIISTQIEEEIPVMILLNKIDLQKSYSRANFIYYFGLLELQKNIWSCYETSAMTGEGLVEAFTNFYYKLEDEAKNNS
jgi:small GTP-binding protein